MPTILPPPRRAERERKLSLLSIVFNLFLVVSALTLTFMVLAREERYALTTSAPMETSAPDANSGIMQVPPG